MKNIKRLSTLLLAIIIVVSMTIMASAQTNTGSITINNAPANTEYSVYCIFDLESYNGDAYSYKVNNNWKAYIETDEAKNYVTVDANGYVTWNENAEQADFATKALDYAQTNNISATASSTASQAGSVEFTELSLGYYLVDSSLGAICALTTTAPDAEINEKNSAPTIVKEVKNGENYASSNNANIGDTIEFRATILVQGDAINYALHDTMSEGLTFGDIKSVKLNNQTVANTLYTLNTTTDDDCTFELVFKPEFCITLNSGDEIVVEYYATLNKDAVINEDGNTNEIILSYKDINNFETTTVPSTTTTKTFEIPVYKYSNGNEDAALAGAGFTLYVDEDCKTAIKFDNNGIHDTNGALTELVTNNNGVVTFSGIASGTYYLKETTAPQGYNKLNTVVKVVINDDGSITVGDDAVQRVEINNKSGSLLPITGGIGTTIFYVVGGILLLGAIILIITRKRMQSKG